ncbi:hypothetical protein WJX72_010600 [[Myrmecia] bisecta]|uniref:FAD-binding domain-containing protein n=1 Tax=[Myrmecia] bisecta TaxID=41462 RepID=A0AAW1PT73_9CHLO
MPAPLEVLIVGGSIAGLACAHALLKQGCRVTVLERSITIAAAGAGLGLDQQACDILRSFGLGQDLVENSCELGTEVNRVVVPPIQCGGGRTVEEVFRDEQYGHRSTHWSDLHWMLRKGLPEGVMQLGHTCVAFEQIEERRRVRITAAVGHAGELRSYEGDLMVAADGAMSETRAKLVPGETRRYSGYCAWRGVMTAHPELMTDDEQAVVARVRAAYPDLGRAIYFEMAQDTHAVLYELPGKRLNWLWYVAQPQPKLPFPSVIFSATEQALQKMHLEAYKTWPLALSQLMKATAAPFIHAIVDKEPLSRFVWGRVVLVGEAAHPTTPHGLRSTNMALADAAMLGSCIANSGGDIEAALSRFEHARVSCTAREALFSRYLGQLKQGMLDSPAGSFDWSAANPETRQLLSTAQMPDFDHQRYAADPAAFGPRPSSA